MSAAILDPRTRAEGGGMTVSNVDLERALGNVRRLESELDAARKGRDRLIAETSVVVETAPTMAPLVGYVLVTPRRRHAVKPGGGTYCGRQDLPRDEALPVPASTLLDVVTCEECRRELQGK